MGTHLLNADFRPDPDFLNNSWPDTTDIVSKQYGKCKHFLQRFTKPFTVTVQMLSVQRNTKRLPIWGQTGALRAWKSLWVTIEGNG